MTFSSQGTIDFEASICETDSLISAENWKVSDYSDSLHSGKLTWQWKIPIFNREYIFKWSIFRCHVSLPRVFTDWFIRPKLSTRFFWEPELEALLESPSRIIGSQN